MPFLFVYQASDFVGGLPDESGARAAGNPPFTLTLAPGATPMRIEVSDDDSVFDEIDASQALADTADINGTTWPAGTTINTAYDLQNSGSGHKITSFHMGGDGFQQGPVDGLVSSVPLTPGNSYTFDSERTSHQQNNLYDGYVACFASGTLIETADGPRPVETLKPGDPLMTLDHGPQPLRMALSRCLQADDLAAHPNMKPILIRAGALGKGLPERDLRLSPQHRVLARSTIVRRMFGVDDVLIAAKKLTGLPGVEVDQTCTELRYHHLVMPRHEVLLAEGAPAESFYIGPFVTRFLPEESLCEMRSLFPNLTLPAARPIPSGRRQGKLIARHTRNMKPLLA